MSDNEEDPDIPRIKLPSFSSMTHVIEAIRKAKKIIVITGAGISVSSGIPDFRSKDIGIYHTLDCDQYNIPSAELLFDYEFFRIDAEPFYKFSSHLLPNDDVRPSPCHNFIACLQTRGKLLRNYTQNVDGLERKAGITKLIECHGSMMNFSCMDCRRKRKLADVKQEVIAGSVAYCRAPSCGGTLKPDITFFGELLPQPFFKAIKQDVSKCDLVVVIGTSLKVGGSVHLLLKHVEDRVPQVLINREAVVPPASVSGGFDVSLLGECDNIAKYLCDSLGWPLEPLANSQCDETKDDSLPEATYAQTEEKQGAKKGEKKAAKPIKVEVNVDESDESKPALSSSSMTPATSSEDPLSRWICSQTAERIFAITQNPMVANTARSPAKVSYSATSTGTNVETAVENILFPRNKAVKGVKERPEGKKSKSVPSDIVTRKAGYAAVRKKAVPASAVTVIAATAVSTSGSKRGHQLRGASSERTPEAEICVSKRSRGSAVSAPQPVLSARTRMTRMPEEEVVAVIPSCRSKRRSGCVDESPAVDIISITVDEGIVSEFDDVVAVKRGRGRPRKIIA